MKNTMNMVNNNKENRTLISKRKALVNELILGFDLDESLVLNFNVWAYSEDTLRTATSIFSNAAAMPFGGWSKYTEVVLSNKRLYLIGLTQHMDYVRKEVIDLNKDIESLNIFSTSKEEVLSLVLKGRKEVQFKTDSPKFSNLYEAISNTFGKLDTVKYHKDEKASKPFGIKALLVENLIYVGFGLASLGFIFSYLF